MNRTDPTENVLSVQPLGFQWQTLDPFLFCVHHDDRYPKGNEHLGPATSLQGRNLGEDFTLKDGFRMYHGEVVPGFPAHPHRGFETVTLVRKGYIDHSDSLGATARFGGGDAQWLTAGAGIQHSEMFPLVDAEKENPVELFQIWLNLPKEQKGAPPHFSMFWNERIPRVRVTDDAGRATEVTLVAGELNGVKALPPPPESWASRPEADLAIWTLKLEPGARFTLPPAREGTHRVLYAFRGAGLDVSGKKIPGGSAVQVRPLAELVLEAGPEPVELVLLQGRPISEPVVQHGPFVGNSPDDIRRAFTDFQKTGFGGWGFGRMDPVHPRAEGRFARYPDGHVERP